ncbi:DNA topoisomerase III [Catenovulum sp. SX2]|uniref:DNA topoisomerase III n=1 Tax=Catenovulum sp. SX2 TaxID=3398614 RepID=UPI003F863E44
MQLYIAEKPSLARAIASVLPKPQKNQQGYIELANGDCITWCIGHLLENAQPEDYDARYKSWRMQDLPICPDKWQLKSKKQTSKQLTAVKKLIKQAAHIIHAGDPDREGQLLVDEVIHHCQYNTNKGVSRLLISDLNPSAVKQALNKLQNNQNFKNLSTSALARSRADWLYGINLSRAFTIKAKQASYSGVVSIGRVQTPLLGLIARRDEEIDAFVPHPFYQVKAHLLSPTEQPFIAWWQPSEACAPHQDSEGRVINKKLAEHVVGRIQQQHATVTKTTAQNKKQNAPLTYNLSTLQIDAAKALSLTAQQTLDICQSLYEKHKLITYPRSDCRYLPKEHFSQAASVTQAIANNLPEMQNAVNNANLKQKSACWNDKKVTAHHAIIPTSKKTSAQLTSQEKAVYQLISRQYLMQFYPTYEYKQQKIELDIAGGVFVAKANTPTQLGWKALLPQKKQPQKSQPQKKQSNKSSLNKGNSEAEEQTLPELKQGEVCFCQQGELVEKMTSPPEHFTDATLLAAMTGISRFVKDAEIKKILKETDGLGTEATRASMIEVLQKRGFIQRQGKQIRASQTGRDLIKQLPEQLTLPDMTAQWEATLEQIYQGENSYQNFIRPLQQQLVALVEQCQNLTEFKLTQSEQKKRFYNKGSKAKSTRATSSRSARSTAKSGSNNKVKLPKKAKSQQKLYG